MKILILTICLSLLLESERLCIEQVGTKEAGFNRGQRIKEYLKSVDLTEGNPYCMAGIYWAFDSASKITKCRNPLLKTGSVVSQFNYLTKVAKTTKSKPVRHSLVFWRYGKTWKGHIGRILLEKGNGWFYIVEFNTGRNAREGDGVWIKLRNLYHPLARMNIIGVLVWEAKS